MIIYKTIKTKIKHALYVFKRHIFYDVLNGNFAKPAHFVKTILARKLFDRPYLAMIETCNFCNLRCPTCTTPRDKISRAKAVMKLGEYKKIINNIKDYISVVLPWFSNEPFINADMIEMIKYSHQNNLYTVISTNAVLLDEKKSKEVMESGLDEIILCLDGMSKESYEPFREGADFDKVINNIKNFCSLKKKTGLKKPFVEIQFILTKLNQKEVESARSFARSLGVDRFRVKSFALSEYAYTKDEIKDLSEKFLPDDPRYSAKIRYEKAGDILEIKNKKKKCDLVSSNIVVLTDGSVVMCCYDLNGKYSYGNALENNLKDFWNAEGVKKKRKIAQKRGYDLCKICAN